MCCGTFGKRLLLLSALFAACNSSPGGVPGQTCTVDTSPLYPAPRFISRARHGVPVGTVCIEGYGTGLPADFADETDLRIVSKDCDWTIILGPASLPLPPAAQAIWDEAPEDLRYYVYTELHDRHP